MNRHMIGEVKVVHHSYPKSSHNSATAARPKAAMTTEVLHAKLEAAPLNVWIGEAAAVTVALEADVALARVVTCG